jgi:hypothetical protein
VSDENTNLSPDKELAAMGAIAYALQSLDQDATRRVLDWATKRYLQKVMTYDAASSSTIPAAASIPALSTSATFEAFHALFDAANPKSATERALVAGYWFQVVLGNPDFDSQALNRELKHLGHVSTNITRDLDQLMARTPRFVIQTRKLGSSRQARKQYALTNEGIKVINGMLGR